MLLGCYRCMKKWFQHCLKLWFWFQGLNIVDIHDKKGWANCIVVIHYRLFVIQICAWLTNNLWAWVSFETEVTRRVASQSGSQLVARSDKWHCVSAFRDYQRLLGWEGLRELASVGWYSVYNRPPLRHSYQEGLESEDNIFPTGRDRGSVDAGPESIVSKFMSTTICWGVCTFWIYFSVLFTAWAVKEDSEIWQHTTFTDIKWIANYTT